MLTRLALENRALTIAAFLLALIVGPISLATHPSREDPRITIRQASVVARFPGMSASRVENLITSKIEEKIREIPEVDTLETISSNGQALLKIVIADKFNDMQPIWTNLRNKMRDIVSDLPDGTLGPFVDDEKGNVAMATIAMTAEGFANAEMHLAAKAFRRVIYAEVEGVRKVEFFGRLEQRVFVEFDTVRLGRMGLSPSQITAAISQQNVVLPGGRVEADGRTFVIEPTGDFGGLEQVRDTALSIPGSDAPIYLADIADIHFGYEDPPGKPMFWNGEPALVISVSMIDNFDAFAFGERLRAVTDAFEQRLPVGFELDYVTWQPDEIQGAVFGVFNNLWQTVLIVLVVVIAFLGFRTGLIVGALVPLVMLTTTLVMRPLGVELERMSLASLIIALGLLIDNGIVVAEEIRSRISRGQDRVEAALEAGRLLTGPLLAASLTTILAFMPLMLAPGGAGEYTRSISLVIAIALLISWVAALSILALLCMRFVTPDLGGTADKAYSSPFYRRYRGALGWALDHRFLTLGIAAATLPLGMVLFGFVSKTFFPKSERAQLQIEVDLPQGANAYATMDVTDRLQNWLNNEEINPEVASVATYISDGGPRFYLSLEPPDGFPNTAYMLATLKDAAAVSVLEARVRRFNLDYLPEAELYPKPMSLGPNESGLVEYRIAGPDSAVLKAAAEQLQLALRRIEGTRDVTDDWKNPNVTLRAAIDQEAARRAGVSSEDIATALNSQLSGLHVTDFRLRDETFPVIFRAEAEDRTTLDRLRTLSVGLVGESPVTLEQVARIEPEIGFSRVRRRDLERVVTVKAKHARLAASELDALMAPEIASLRASLPRVYRIEKGGEIEASATAQTNLFANLPLALALMVLVLIWQFDSFKRAAMVFATIPLTLFGVSLALIVAPGANFSFMGILGFLALAGIVINNAIVLIDRIDSLRAEGRARDEAILEAGVQRLRPIVMTTCTTALGLAPIIVSRDVLFYDLAVVVAGGLLVGTVLTLVVTPCLYTVFFKKDDARAAA